MKIVFENSTGTSFVYFTVVLGQLAGLSKESCLQRALIGTRLSVRGWQKVSFQLVTIDWVFVLLEVSFIEYVYIWNQIMNVRVMCPLAAKEGIEAYFRFGSGSENHKGWLGTKLS